MDPVAHQRPVWFIWGRTSPTTHSLSVSPCVPQPQAAAQLFSVLNNIAATGLKSDETFTTAGKLEHASSGST